LKRYKIDKNKIGDYPTFPVGYGRKLRVMVPYPVKPREGKCDACGRSIKSHSIKQTHLHHWMYEYHHKTVQKDPSLALVNCSELCPWCHRKGDAFRELFEKAIGKTDQNMWMYVKLALLMPSKGRNNGLSMKERLDRFCRQYLVARESDTSKKYKIEHFFEEEE